MFTSSDSKVQNSAKTRPKKEKTSTAGVHEMRPFRRHSFIIIDIIVVFVVVIVVVGHLMSFQPQKQRFLSFENNTGPIDGRTLRRF